ncbi:MAG: GNAT family N-acetyltransferase [Actinomycetota bacterium]|nr:GNAT family N-acetyltransferase [Actinomycetota bacterium]
MTRWPEDVPHLSNGRVGLRAHRDDDVPAIVEMCRDPLARRWTDLPDPYEPSDAESFLREKVAPGWQAGSARGWAIEVLDADGGARYAGNLDIRGGPAADIGFLLHPWARGRGAMSDAVRLALQWCFAEGTESVTWLARVGNVASLRVAWACGFTFNGTLPRRLGRPPLADAWIGTVVAGDELMPKNRWLTPTVLRGNRIRLRPFDADDIPRIVEGCSDARTAHWLAQLPDPYTEGSARAYLDTLTVNESLARGIAWCVADLESDSLLGSIGLMDLEPDKASGEVGYWTHPDARGRGVMTEAVNLVVEHALAPAEPGLRMRRLQLLAAAGNTASIEIARRAGFSRVGREREAERLRDGTFDDLITFDLLASDHRRNA